MIQLNPWEAPAGYVAVANYEGGCNGCAFLYVRENYEQCGNLAGVTCVSCTRQDKQNPIFKDAYFHWPRDESGREV